LEAQEANTGLLGALASLPRNQQDCIRLKFQQDLSYQQISGVTWCRSSSPTARR